MITDKYGQQIYNEEELCDLMLTNTQLRLSNVLVEENIHVPLELDLQYVPKLIKYTTDNAEVEQFDKIKQSSWNFPDSYKNMDIAKYVLDRCSNDTELQRAGQELLIYQKRELFTLLKYLKYLVDIMKSNNIIYGVGRGSSVASFVLYLLEVHKINSLYYDLSIDEFLK